MGGGLVILQGSLPLLLEARNNRLTQVEHMLVFANAEELQDPSKQICICCGVLPHGVNVSYGKNVGQIIDKVNGNEVTDMRHLASVLHEQKVGALIVDFRAVKGRNFIVFDMADVRGSEEEILNANCVPYWCTPSLLNVEETSSPSVDANV